MELLQKEIRHCYKNLRDREALSESLTKITSEIRSLKKKAEHLEKLKIKMQEKLAVLKYKTEVDAIFLRELEEIQGNNPTFSNHFKNIESKS